MITTEEKILDAKEFTSVLLSCELSVELNKDKPNKSLKNCLAKCEKRVTSPRIKLVCKQGRSNLFPQGWLNRQLNNIIRIGRGKMSRDEFLDMGASL